MVTRENYFLTEGKVRHIHQYGTDSITTNELGDETVHIRKEDFEFLMKQARKGLTLDDFKSKASNIAKVIEENQEKEDMILFLKHEISLVREENNELIFSNHSLKEYLEDPRNSPYLHAYEEELDKLLSTIEKALPAIEQAHYVSNSDPEFAGLGYAVFVLSDALRKYK